MDASIVREAQRFFETRASLFETPYLPFGPYNDSGEQREIHGLPRPDFYVEVPPAALEAAGFYFTNVLLRDNGSVYPFQTDGDCPATFDVYSSTDGDESYLEVYDAHGVYVCGAVISGGAVFDWRDKDAIRRHAGIEGRE